MTKSKQDEAMPDPGQGDPPTDPAAAPRRPRDENPPASDGDVIAELGDEVGGPA